MMQDWFKDAKLGIFMHWGIYSAYGVSESWSFFNGSISYENYMKQCGGFTAGKYDAKSWADLFRRAGAKYSVLTAKHHDGVALWDTKLSDLSVAKQTPAARDVLKEYCDAVREAGLKNGIYFSHLDWSHPDYPSVWKHGQELTDQQKLTAKRFSYPVGKNEDPEAWKRFLAFHRGQLKELCTQYRPDLLWFDGSWERSPEQWDMKGLRDQLHQWAPGVILNSRMGGYGDYETPEQGIPVEAPSGPWEFCMTLNDSWGYQFQDVNHKSTRQLVRYFVDVISMGGNLLLDIGPYADGRLQPTQVQRLEELGAWIAPRAEAIYGTIAGLPRTHFAGGSTMSKDQRTIYLFLHDRPWDQIAVKGIKNNVTRISVVGSGRELTGRKIGGAHWANIPGVLWIDVPQSELEENATVIKIELDGPLDLWRGKGVAIEAN